MIRRFPLAWRCLPFLCLPFFACAAAAPAGGGSGGSTGTGGSATGTGGSATGSGGSASGTGGSGETLPAFLSHGPYPFPQNKASGSCTLTTTSNASAATSNAYTSWKGSFLTASGAPSGAMRVQDPQSVGCGSGNQTNATVSEGMGYGMLAAVYMNDHSTFDQLLAYVNAHLDANGLMNWCVTSSGSTGGAGSASDADEDIAWSLLMAAAQWSSTSYYDAAKAMINNIYGHSIAGDGTLTPGDAWGGTTIYPDYFSPAYFRVFAKVGSANWGTVILDRNYAILANVSGTHGLVPNQSDSQTYSTSMNYGYDSCRMPWRIAMDYCFNGEQRALTYLQLVGAFFNGVSGGAANIGDGYTTSGSQTSSNHNMAFIGTAGTAGMASWPNLLNGAFSFGVNGAGDNAYFTNSLRVVTMLMMSGNLLDYSQQ